MKKRILSVVLIFVIAVSMLSFCVITTYAYQSELHKRIETIKNVYPTGTYFTASGGPAYDWGDPNNLYADSQIQNIPSRGGLPAGWETGCTGTSCWAFAQYCFYYVFGHNFYTNVFEVAQPNYGDVIYFYEYWGSSVPSHYAIYLEETTDYYYVYDCNWNGNCNIGFYRAIPKANYAFIKAFRSYNYDSLYFSGPVPSNPSTAPTVAKLNSDKLCYAVDETVTFSATANGNTNTLWIYCPDGSQLYYKNIGTSHQLAFGMSGHFQALVQTWNDVGNLCSEKIDFYVGMPHTIAYNSNGGSGSMSSHTVKYKEQFTLRKNTFTKTDYKFVGWHLKNSDNKWFVLDVGWCTESEINNKGYKKHIYINQLQDNINEGWTSKPSDTFTFYAVWEYSHTHSYTNYTYNNDATHSADGTETGTCSCGLTSTRTKSGSKIISHRYETYIYNNDATCKADGTISAKCTVTGCQSIDTITATGTKTNNHSYGSYVSDNNATTEADGTKTRTCSVCGSKDTVTDVGSKLPTLDEPMTSGSCGKNSTWSFDTDTGILTISGTGDISYLYNAPWHSFKDDIISIKIGSGITSICNDAFSYYSNLTSVTIGNSVTSIGRSAFSGCSKLTSILIPDSVTSIGECAFFACNGLQDSNGFIIVKNILFDYNGTGENISIPNNVILIDKWAFTNCSNLVSVIIPNGVTTIGWGGFSNCSALKSITIPDSVTSIGYSAFYNCNSLTTVNYCGSESNRANITIDEAGNDPLLNAVWVYNYNSTTPKPTPTPTPNPTPEVEIKDTSKIFEDIPAKKWFKEYVDYSVAYGIFKGKTKTEFAPNDNITRAEFVQVLANLQGVDTSNRNVTTSFIDVPAKKWFTPAVKWASDNKIVNGVGNGKFDPNANVTREQMCLMLVNFAKFKSITLKSVESKENFADDGSISKWAKNAVYTCQQADIVNGKGAGKFDPQGTGTRAEASVIFTKFHKDYLAK